jgi:hypothetical protein
MRPLILLGLVACAPRSEPGFFGVLANDAVEQFDALCHANRGGHAVRDPTHERARFFYRREDRPLGAGDDSFVCDDDSGVGVMTFDRTTRELLVLDLEVPEEDVPLAQHLLRPALTCWEQIGLLGETQRSRLEQRPWEKQEARRGFFDRRVNVSATFMNEKDGVRYVDIGAEPRIVEVKKK